ncbi:hypothetical protein N7462_007493 [Penicillium macrosclerotiorum]|uniref:uncharacterized protein n=1 Tax=Penicillium macrosclerotiorum TaxID=303699 RepID=UPI00254796E7|nr:uncharacterized protein N7462_007493 [Penicillium macrosclerotiorum]KAJ5679249.1 hypothetical protein N7462_007493 [Penicillium macrosclerotiorum]
MGDVLTARRSRGVDKDDTSEALIIGLHPAMHAHEGVSAGCEMCELPEPHDASGTSYQVRDGRCGILRSSKWGREAPWPAPAKSFTDP